MSSVSLDAGLHMDRQITEGFSRKRRKWFESSIALVKSFGEKLIESNPAVFESGRVLTCITDILVF